MLYCVDENLAPRPQMAAGHVIEDDGKRWVITLRDGLRFHDGEPVLARDCMTSANRWMKRDSTGLTLAQRLDAIEAPDDRTVVFRLKQPFPQLSFVLGKASSNMMAVMPSRLAAVDAYKPVPELVGSGPFRFVPDEFSAASRVVLARFEEYEPRDDKPSGTSGGRVAKVDRIEWRTIPEPATQAAALMTGEIDWISTPVTRCDSTSAAASRCRGAGGRPFWHGALATAEPRDRSDRQRRCAPRHHGCAGRARDPGGRGG